MSDLISRQAAIDELDKGAWGVEWDKALAKAMIESLPSAQPEIIYCRNCRYSKDSGDYQDSYFCYNPHHNQAYLVHSMEFCYHAERKDNG